MTPALETIDLTKYYGPICGAEGITFTVEAGEVYGFLGPNGSGKTTTIRLLLDLIRPTRGSARLLGHDVRRDLAGIRARLGYAPAEVELYGEMTGLAVLDAFARLRPERKPAHRGTMLEVLDLSARDLARRVSDYSTGMKRKIVLTLAMQHDPDLLILDEPTQGLDPLRQRALLDHLRALAGRGRTVFFSSHNLAEVEGVCDRVGIVARGRLAAVESIDELGDLQLRRVEVVLAPGSTPPRLDAPGLEVIEHDGARWVVRVDGAFDALIRALADCRVANLTAEPPRLEEVFFDYYREETQ